MTSDPIVTTRASKQVHLDKDVMLARVEGLPDYFVICLTPSSRWVLISLLSHLAEYYRRWDNWDSHREIDQLSSETLLGLFCPMACSDDIQAIIAAMEVMNTTLAQIRDRIAPDGEDVDTDLKAVVAGIATLDTTISDFGLPELLDKLEPMLNGVGVILGAPPISSNGA